MFIPRASYGKLSHHPISVFHSHYSQDEEDLMDRDDPIPDAGAQEDEDDVYDSHDNVEEPRQANLHPDDPANFFKLSKFLKIVLAHSITNDDINDAEGLIRSYCTELLHVSFFLIAELRDISPSLKLYGKHVIRPNHHYATHVPDCLRDYGPMVGFWTFLFERLNKILKSYNSSNHSGGELEVSFFREFHRTMAHSRMVCLCDYVYLLIHIGA
jgi:hypothetical protein